MPVYKKILMVDDDEEDRMLMQDTLNEIGASEIAHYEASGENALSYLQNLSANELPSLIVLDLNMPRINGTQVLKMIKENDRLKNITVIIYSTSVNHIEKEETLKLGAHSYVVKPSSYKECIERAKYFQILSDPNSTQ